jgi:hypothetical protein
MVKAVKSFAKRFNVTGVTRDKEYDLTRGMKRVKCIISGPAQW